MSDIVKAEAPDEVLQQFAEIANMDRESVQEILADNFSEGDRPEIERLKIPAGGTLAFETPGEDGGEPDYLKQIVGVIVHHNIARAYWIESQGENASPDCSSVDGKTGFGVPGGACATCGMNQWNSGHDGRGKACKEMRRLYIVMPGDILPVMLSLPPTSIRSFLQYSTRLTRNLKSIKSVMTKITLEKKENSAGQPYAVATFASMGVLPDNIALAMRVIGQTVSVSAQSVPVDNGDYDTHTDYQENPATDTGPHPAEREESEEIAF